ncbi:MAG: carboxypeptidase-like regulatory domain-containing protein [Planctomycetota bacterium]|jgi:formate-dependent nitrite reductase cytochrome c552 subunit
MISVTAAISRVHRYKLRTAGAVLCATLAAVAGCPSAGGGGAADTGTVAGTVTNDLTGSGIAGVTVTLDPAVDGVDVTTGADGTYSANVPPGDYTLTFEADNFESQTATVSVTAGDTATANAALTPTEPVAVSATVEGDAAPGGSVAVTATAAPLDGSEVLSYNWQQSNSVDVTIAGADTATPTVTLPDVGAFKDELFHVLAEPPIGEDELPPNVELPEGEFPGGLQDRFQVVGLNPFALEEAGLVTLTLTVTTTSGEFASDVEIHAELPWKVSSDLQNVPTGRIVLLHGKTQDAYDWALNAPGGSGAALTDATSQNPYFTPDVSGQYTVTVTNTTGEADEEATLEITAGTWAGAITGQDTDGRPLAANCTVCHNGGIAPDNFTPWAQTGHAEIFTNNLNTSTHYGEGCFDCHTVGFDTTVDNGGIDEASDYQGFLNAGLINVPDDNNWTTVLSDFPETAKLANIQCESCHGPNPTPHASASPGRTSISSGVCAACHGEPLRHARFQQWQLSGHGNYELAIEEGTRVSCARCHTGNGFLGWLPVLLDDDPSTDPTADITVDWAPDETHPQTCVTCHDPHSVGTISGGETDVTVRIFDDTPPLIAGFSATGVGNGAICMTCHNSRRGLRNDDTFGETRVDDAARAPHGSAQTDVLMGQNAYFVEVGTPGNHASVDDTCVNCHMEATPPPELLSYEQGGTNHTFSASPDICSNCHTFGAEVVQPGIEADLQQLKGLIEDAILQLMTEQIDSGSSISLTMDDEIVETITDVSNIASLNFGESHGRQSIAVSFADGTTLGAFRMNDVFVVDAAGETAGELYDFAEDDLIKAGWNWNLVNNDGSRGVHNPAFAASALDEAITALGG